MIEATLSLIGVVVDVLVSRPVYSVRQMVAHVPIQFDIILVSNEKVPLPFRWQRSRPFFAIIGFRFESGTQLDFGLFFVFCFLFYICFMGSYS